ncbi:hypothetical protein [Rhodococcoides yunnanense]|uniref:hypothetical protein n=1 Tax=Rhodococcoides yunnanense TaxID=278209 RepID=UPI001FE6F494|nr:hypothetical protein [Rhodococcus yunnanensis]
MRKRLLVLAASLVAFNAALWLIPKIAPEAPGRWEGVQPAAPPTASASTTPPPPLPADFPSMERPPPTIDVPEGQPQPIATKFGLTYDIPADWVNASTGFGGWEDESGWSVVYGAIGRYGYEVCSAKDGSTLGLSGATGSADLDLAHVATEHAQNAPRIFGAPVDDPGPTVTYSEPQKISAAGSPAVRVTATVRDITRESPCDPPSATFDILTTTSHATAPTAVFMVQLDAGVDGAADHSIADEIFSTIRRSE